MHCLYGLQQFGLQFELNCSAIGSILFKNSLTLFCYLLDMEHFINTLSGNREYQVLLMFSVVILPSFIMGLWSFLCTKALQRRVLRTVADIKHAEIYRGYNACYRNCLTVTYKDKSGQEFSGVISVADNKLKAGQKVDVLYDPVQPSTVLNTDRMFYYAASYCMFFIAIGFGIILAALILNGRIHLPPM
jgi:hypothetical protein